MSFQDVQLKQLTIETIKDFVRQHSYMVVHNPGGELFQAENENGDKTGLLVDVQSLSLLSQIYDNLNPTNQSRFNTVLQDEYKFANLLDKMWSWAA